MRPSKTSQIAVILAHFRFAQLADKLGMLKWVWADPAGVEPDAVPDTDALEVTALHLLNKVATADEREPETAHGVAQGGLEASSHRGWLSLRFVLHRVDAAEFLDEETGDGPDPSRDVAHP